MDAGTAELVTTVVGGGTAGVIALLLLALLTSKSGIWHWDAVVKAKALEAERLLKNKDLEIERERKQYEVRLAERDAIIENKDREIKEWKQLALQGTRLLDQAVSERGRSTDGYS